MSSLQPRFERARMYQASITHFFERNTTPHVARTATPLQLQSTTHGGVAVRRYEPGAGQSTLPIDVEAWTASEPIDVDTFGTDARPESAESPEVATSAMPAAGESAEATTLGPAAFPYTLYILTRRLRAAAAHASPQSHPQRTEEEERLEDLFTCCICKDTFINPVVTLCPHVYCDHCIFRNFGRDMLFERELAVAIENGIVPPPESAGRRHPYDYVSITFPPV
ncbi:hypothetical protein B0H11DRAFT_2235358 [Mycena galericulata]|nr:hypothetical protein B0H11DRAFT_2235358 [Mycena galericulata]